MQIWIQFHYLQISLQLFPPHPEMLLFSLGLEDTFMHELTETNIQTNPFDHPGIVAAVCCDLKIAERIEPS